MEFCINFETGNGIYIKVSNIFSIPATIFLLVQLNFTSSEKKGNESFFLLLANSSLKKGSKDEDTKEVIIRRKLQRMHFKDKEILDVQLKNEDLSKGKC